MDEPRQLDPVRSLRLKPRLRAMLRKALSTVVVVNWILFRHGSGSCVETRRCVGVLWIGDPVKGRCKDGPGRVFSSTGLSKFGDRSCTRSGVKSATMEDVLRRMLELSDVKRPEFNPSVPRSRSR